MAGVLTRFKVGDEGEQTQIKARIYERATYRRPCVICNQVSDSTLIRHIEPKKMDTYVCHKCLTLISLGAVIEINDLPDTYFGKFSPKKIVKDAKRRAKKQTGTRIHETVVCPFCKKEIGKPGLKSHVSAKHSEVDVSNLGVEAILQIQVNEPEPDLSEESENTIETADSQSKEIAENAEGQSNQGSAGDTEAKTGQ